MKKKIMAMCLVIAMAATAVIGGTLAYFTDTDSATNVMTLGNVDIKQVEEQRYFNEEGDVWTMGDFVQDKPLMPMVDSREKGDAIVVKDEVAGANVFHPKMNNVVDKFVSVVNVAEEGAINQDVYARTILAFETNKEYKAGTDEVLRDGKEIFDTYIGTLGSFELLERDVITVDGVEYVLAVKVYEEALAPGEKSAPSLKQIFMSPDANNEIATLFGNEYTILALSQATQTAGFEDAEEALNAAFGNLETIDEAKLVEWLSAVNN